MCYSTAAALTITFSCLLVTATLMASLIGSGARFAWGGSRRIPAMNKLCTFWAVGQFYTTTGSADTRPARFAIALIGGRMLLAAKFRAG